MKKTLIGVLVVLMVAFSGIVVNAANYGTSYSVVQGNPATYPVLSYGDTGEYVILAQQCLNVAGYSCKVDGRFGTETKSKVIAFQKAKNLSPDGIIGVKTWTCLLKYLA